MLHLLASTDQWLGIVVSRVLCKRLFQSPEDVAEICLEELGPLATARSETMFATIVEGERDWGAWLADLGVSFAGAFKPRRGVWAPHAFSFKLRQDLLAHERAQIEDEVRKMLHRSRPTHDSVVCSRRSRLQTQ